MRPWILGSMLLLGALLQTTVLHHLRIFGVKPDLVIIVVSSYAVLRGRGHGAAAGFAGGLLLDLLTSSLVGLGALTKMLAGYITGLLEDKVFKQNYIVPVVASVVATFVDQTAYLLVMQSFHFDISLWGGMAGIVLPLCAYNGVLSVPVYAGMLALERRACNPLPFKKAR